MSKLLSACVFLLLFPSVAALADTEFGDPIPTEIVEVFESQDWTQFPLFSRATQEVGFIAPNQFNVGAAQIICHDDLG